MSTEQQVNGNPQINGERNTFNQRVSRLAYLGKSSKVKWSAEILGREWEQRTFPYQVKCLKWIREEFRSLGDKHQTKVLNLLKDTDCERILN